MATLVGDTDYQIRSTDRLVILGEPLSESRVWTLPEGGAFDSEELTVVDATGSLGEDTLTIAGPSGVLINGESSYVLSAPYAQLRLVYVSPVAWVGISPTQTAQALAGLRVRNLSFAFDTPDIDTGANLVVPELGEAIVALTGAVVQAWDSSESDAIDLGVTGSTDDFIDGQDAQTLAALTISGAVGYIFDGEEALVATVVGAGDAPTEGLASLTLITAPATLPEA